MESNFTRFAMRYNLPPGRLTSLSISIIAWLPVLYLLLVLPKTIINDAIGPAALGQFVPIELMGRELQVLDYLLLLCTLYIVLWTSILIWEFHISTVASTQAGQAMAAFRDQLIRQARAFSPPRLDTVNSKDVSEAIFLRTEVIRDALEKHFALAAHHSSVLLAALIFLFVQEWKLGLAAIALVPVEVYVRRLVHGFSSRLEQEKVRAINDARNKLGRLIENAQSGHQVVWNVAAEIDVIRQADGSIDRRNRVVAFLTHLNQAISVSFFLSIGGYLVISGHLSFGALVASLLALPIAYRSWRILTTRPNVVDFADGVYAELRQEFS